MRGYPKSNWVSGFARIISLFGFHARSRCDLRPKRRHPASTLRFVAPLFRLGPFLTVAFLGVAAPSQSVNASPEVDALKETILTKRFAEDWRSYALAEARLRLERASPNAAREEIDTAMAAVATRLDEMESLATTGQLPNRDTALYERAASTLKKTIGAILGGPSGTLASEGLDYFWSAIVGSTKAQTAQAARVNLDTIMRSSRFGAAQLARDVNGHCRGKDCSGFTAAIGISLNSSPEAYRQFWRDETRQDMASGVLAILDEVESLRDQQRQTDADVNEIQEKIDALAEQMKQLVSAEYQKVIDQIGALTPELEETILSAINQNQEAFLQKINALDAQTGQNARYLTAINEWIEAEEARRAEQERQRAELQELSELVASFSAIDRFSRLIGAPQEVVQFTSGMSMVASTALEIKSQLGIIKAAGGIGTIAGIGATFNIASAGLVLLSAFDSGGPSGDEQILAEIAKLRQQIEEFRVEMNERFNRIDERLDTVLQVLVDGFRRLENGQQLLLAGVRDNTQIGLNTQALIIRETNRTRTLVADFFLNKCTAWRSTTLLPIPDSMFIGCAIDLGNFGTDSIQNLPQFDANWTESELRTNLEAAEAQGEHHRILLEALSHFTGNSAIRSYLPMVNPEQWAVTSGWYRDFLVEDVGQTRRLIGANDLMEMASIGRNAIEFRREVLAHLDASSWEDGSSFLGAYLDTYQSFITSYIQGNFTSRTLVEYRNANMVSFPPVAPEVNPDAVPRLNMTFQEITDFHRSENIFPILKYFGPANLDPTKSIRLNPDVLEYFYQEGPEFQGFYTGTLGPMPAGLKAVIMNGLGNLKFEVLVTTGCNGGRYVGEDFYSEGCRFPVNIYLEDRYGLWTLGDLLIESFTVTVPEGMVLAEGGGAFDLSTYNSPQYQYKIDLISKAVKQYITTWPLSYSGSQQINAQWEYHRGRWAEQMKERLDSELRAADLRVQRANILMAAVVRFALGDEMNEHDAVYTLGQGITGIPTLSRIYEDIGTSADSFSDLLDYLSVEREALQSYLLSPEFQEFVLGAKEFNRIEHVIDALSLAADILKSNEEVPPLVDADGDGVPNQYDAFPFDAAEFADTDLDGLGDNADTDDDGDGVPDFIDDLPTDVTETRDTDYDGIGNNKDTDDDGDGVSDELDPFPLKASVFLDVQPNYWAFSFVEAAHGAKITRGCGPGNFCPEDVVTRAQMAVFLIRGMRGGEYRPPTASGNIFDDVEFDDFAADFIEQLYFDGITNGCGGGRYCSTQSVTRAQMAVFLLRAKYGTAYVPPLAAGVFADVPRGSFAADWIEQLAKEGITSGCGGGNFCPDKPVTRAQMAVFLVRTFGL